MSGGTACLLYLRLKFPFDVHSPRRERGNEIRNWSLRPQSESVPPLHRVRRAPSCSRRYFDWVARCHTTPVPLETLRAATHPEAGQDEQMPRERGSCLRRREASGCDWPSNFFLPCSNLTRPETIWWVRILLARIPA